MPGWRVTELTFDFYGNQKKSVDNPFHLIKLFYSEYQTRNIMAYATYIKCELTLNNMHIRYYKNKLREICTYELYYKSRKKEAPSVCFATS